MALGPASFFKHLLRVDIHDIVRPEGPAHIGWRFMSSVDVGNGDLFIISMRPANPMLGDSKTDCVVTGALEQALAILRSKKAYKPQLFALLGYNAEDPSAPPFGRVSEVLGQTDRDPCLVLFDKGDPVVVNGQYVSIPTRGLKRLYPLDP